MPTGTQLVYGALRLLQVLRPGMTANTASGADGLSELNDLLDNWNTDRLKIYAVTPTVFNLTAAKQSYTLGTGGDFNATRPVKIETANLLTTASAQVIRTPIQMLTKDRWAQIRYQAAASPIPDCLYCDESFPLANVYLYPTPSDSSAQLELYLWTQFTAFASLATNVNFPPGYALAIRYNLARQMAASFELTAKGKANLPLIEELAQQYRRDIESLNSVTPYLRNDIQGRPQGSGFYNWITNNQ